MPKLAIAVWIANVLADTAGRVAFKFAAPLPRKFHSPVLWGGVVCFGAELVLWLLLLRLIPLSQAILVGSMNIITVAIAGRFLFGERLDATRTAGIALIAVGVALAGGAA